jgi:hypothetical protein
MNNRSIVFPQIVKGSFTAADNSLKDVTQEFAITKGNRIKVDLLLTARSASGSSTISLYAGDHLDPTTGARLYKLIDSVTVDNTNPSSVPDTVSIRLNVETTTDQVKFPLPSHGIIRAQSDGTATMTIAKVSVLQEN